MAMMNLPPEPPDHFVVRPSFPLVFHIPLVSYGRELKKVFATALTCPSQAVSSELCNKKSRHIRVLGWGKRHFSCLIVKTPICGMNKLGLFTCWADRWVWRNIWNSLP
jgi:hypothetical protein